MSATRRLRARRSLLSTAFGAYLPDRALDAVGACQVPHGERAITATAGNCPRAEALAAAMTPAASINTPHDHKAYQRRLLVRLFPCGGLEWSGIEHAGGHATREQIKNTQNQRPTVHTNRHDKGFIIDKSVDCASRTEIWRTRPHPSRRCSRQIDRPLGLPKAWDGYSQPPRAAARRRSSQSHPSSLGWSPPDIFRAFTDGRWLTCRPAVDKLLTEGLVAVRRRRLI